MRGLSSLFVMALTVLGLSCSAGVLKPDPCTNDSECRAAFGLGWACGSDSLCTQPGPPARCTSTPATVLWEPSQHEDDLIIGSIFDKTDFDIMVKAARLAVIQVNDRDGLGGRPVGIIECTNAEDASLDALTSEEATVEVGRIMVERYGVPAIVGPATSGRAEVAFNALSPLGTILISPSATSPALTDIDGLPPHTDESPGLFWRTAPPDSLQGRVIAQQMTEVLEVTNAAVIHETGAYGEGLAEVFQENFVGGERTAEAFPFSDITALSLATASVGEGNFDEVLVISSNTSDVVTFLNAAAGIEGFSDKGIFLTDGARDQQLLDDTAGISDQLYPNIRGTVPSTQPGLVYTTFVANYRAVYPGEDPTDFGFSAHAWDAGWLALLGAAWADEQESEITGLNIAKGLRKVSDGSPANIGAEDWTTIRAQFGEGNSVDVNGASGALDYDDATGETTAPILVWVINSAGNAFMDIECVDFSPGPSLCPELDGGDDNDDSADGGDD